MTERIDLAEALADLEANGQNPVREEIDREIVDRIQKYLKEAEESSKAVWEIDGVTVYVRDISIDNDNQMTIDWFTFNKSVDQNELGKKVEELATKLYGENVCKSRKRSFPILSTIKSIFGLSGRT